MEMSGEQIVPAPQQEVWQALNDPGVLKQCVPGCESIEPAGENAYQVLMVARVGPVSAKFKGKLTLSDIDPPRSYALAFEGQGGPAGFAKGSAKVRLAGLDSSTRLSYDVKANVGGKLAQIGSRLVDAAAKKVADDFFKAFNERMSRKEKHHPEEKHHPGEKHHPEPLGRDPELPDVSGTTLGFFAAGALLVVLSSLVTLLN